MIKQCIVIFLVCLIGSLTLVPAPVAASPSDVWIRSELRSRFLRPNTGLTRVQIEVRNRHVTLSGTVTEPQLISRAESRARAIPAVAGVTNK